MTTPPMKKRRVVFSLGSNIGERADTLQGALDALLEAPGLDFIGVSGVYETKPLGNSNQPYFLNAVVVAKTALPAKALLERAQGVEHVFHRTREIPWGPRTVDVDIVMVGDESAADRELILPHPRAHERAFVLVPWHEVEPDGELPGHGRIADLLDGVKDQEIRRCDDVALRPPA
jgi:2-amino-4-hydroxy-6-hydroxymethyldihydropteridine diphosphokinase